MQAASSAWYTTLYTRNLTLHILLPNRDIQETVSSISYLSGAVELPFFLSLLINIGYSKKISYTSAMQNKLTKMAHAENILD